jgi:hypothetical protein
MKLPFGIDYDTSANAGQQTPMYSWRQLTFFTRKWTRMALVERHRLENFGAVEFTLAKGRAENQRYRLNFTISLNTRGAKGKVRKMRGEPKPAPPMPSLDTPRLASPRLTRPGLALTAKPNTREKKC